MIEDQETDVDQKHKFTGIYRAFVVDDEDPRDIGRVKVRVPGIYREEVPEEDLPWAIPALSLSRSGGDNMKPECSVGLSQQDLTTAYNKTGTGGEFVIPAIGNHVWVWFDNGNHMNPVYFAMAPGENDYLTQKQYVKDKIDTKIEQIKKIRKKFTPENGENGFDAKDWASGGHVNARQNIHSSGQIAPYQEGAGDTKANNDEVATKIKGGKYVPRKLSIDNKDSHGNSTNNMDSLSQREWSNFITMDIKPLFDKEEKKIVRDNAPHKYDKDGKLDTGGDTKRNINRFITSTTTQGGTTEVIDNRTGQENYYLIHKNFLLNIDQDGSRKVFIGKNDPRNDLVRTIKTNDDRNKGPEEDTRSNDELLIAGDKKTHVLGNEVEYIKGNSFIQVDKNTQIDVNDSMGIRIRKGDFDIIINGDKTVNERDENASDREKSKEKQSGDLLIDIQNGHMDIHVQKNVNIHVNGDANLKVDGTMKTLVGGDYHLHVKGNYFEKVGGNKKETVGGVMNLVVNSVIKVQAAAYSITTSKLSVSGPIHSGVDVRTPRVSLNKHIHGGVKPGQGITSSPTPGSGGSITSGSNSGASNISDASRENNEKT